MLGPVMHIRCSEGGNDGRQDLANLARQQLSVCQHPGTAGLAYTFLACQRGCSLDVKGNCKDSRSVPYRRNNL